MQSELSTMIDFVEKGRTLTGRHLYLDGAQKEKRRAEVPRPCCLILYSRQSLQQLIFR